MVIFHSYVKLPEGNRNDTLDRTGWISQRCRRSRRWSVCSRRGSIFTILWYHRIGMGQNSVSILKWSIQIECSHLRYFAVPWPSILTQNISKSKYLEGVRQDMAGQMSSIASHGGLCQADHLSCPEQWVALWRHSTAWIWAGASVGGEGAKGDTDHMGVSINGGTPRWMVYNGKCHENMDDLEVLLFQETSISHKEISKRAPDNASSFAWEVARACAALSFAHPDVLRQGQSWDILGYLIFTSFHNISQGTEAKCQDCHSVHGRIWWAIAGGGCCAVMFLIVFELRYVVGGRQCVFLVGRRVRQSSFLRGIGNWKESTNTARWLIIQHAMPSIGVADVSIGPTQHL